MYSKLKWEQQKHHQENYCITRLLAYRLRIPSALAEKLNKSLLTKDVEITIILYFFCRFYPLGSQIRSVVGLPLVVSTYPYSAQTTTMLWTSLPRVFNVSYFHVVFIPDHPTCSNKISYWRITPIAIRSSSVTEQPIGTSPLASYPGQTSSLSLVEFLTRFFREIAEHMCRKHDSPSCGEKTCTILLGSTLIKKTFKLRDEHPRHSFLLNVIIRIGIVRN